MKRGDLALNYIFIIFISTIAVFIIVGLLVNWSMSSKNIMCKLTGECKEAKRIDAQQVNLDDCGTNSENYRFELIKYAKLCYQTKVEGNLRQGEICYILSEADVNCKISPADADSIKSTLKSYANITVDIPTQTGLGNRAIITYDFPASKLVIS